MRARARAHTQTHLLTTDTHAYAQAHAHARMRVHVTCTDAHNTRASILRSGAARACASILRRDTCQPGNQSSSTVRKLTAGTSRVSTVLAHEFRTKPEGVRVNEAPP